MNESSAILKILTGPGSGSELSLAPLASRSSLSFGRHHSCDFVLGDPTVSRKHFLIERAGARLLVVDSSSGNGTFVNGKPVRWVELQNGDIIQAGPFALKVEIARPASPDSGNSEQADSDGPTGANPASEHFDPALRALYPAGYFQGIWHFNGRRYYEAHEVWEEVWLHSTGVEKIFYQMLIQSSVGLCHLSRGNRIGAKSMRNKVREKLDLLPATCMSMDLAAFRGNIEKAFASADNEEPDETAVEPEWPVLLLSEAENDLR